MKTNQQNSFLKWICSFVFLWMAFVLLSSTVIYAANNKNEIKAYEEFLKQKHSIKCKGVETPFSIDAFYVADIDEDGVFELIVANQDVCNNDSYKKGHVHIALYRFKNGRILHVINIPVKKKNEHVVYISATNRNVIAETDGNWGRFNVYGYYDQYDSKPSLTSYTKYKLYKNTEGNRNRYLNQAQKPSDAGAVDLSSIEKEIKKSAVSFAKIFYKKAKNAGGSTSQSAVEELRKLKNQLTIIGYDKGTEVPDEVLEAFATVVLNTINDANIDEYEINQTKLTEQIYKQVKAGMNSGSRQITLGKDRNKITYTVKYTIFASSFLGNGAQVSWADVTWKDTKNKRYTVHIVANSTNEGMKKALSSYCAVLAQLNKGLWKDFMVKYITDLWELADLNSIKKLDDKTVSKYFDRCENVILLICGDKKAEEALFDDIKGELEEKLTKMTKKQFQDFIKRNVPNGDKLVNAAAKYKKVNDKYNDCKKKYEKWSKSKKNSDLTKYEEAYYECQNMLNMFNDSLGEI